MRIRSNVERALLAEDAPMWEKLYAWLHQSSPDVVSVVLLVRLDTSSPAERVAADLFADDDGTLTVRYHVAIKLADERKDLAEKIHAAYKRAALTAAPLTRVAEDTLRSLFAPIAELGASIFRQLFQPHRFDSHADEDAPLLRDALRSVFSRELMIVLQSPEPLFPWAFLYGGERFDELDSRTIDFGCFWGFRHQIQEELDGVSRRRCISAPPAIVAAICPIADSAGEHRRGPLGQIPKDRVIWLSSVLALERELRAFDADCLYFFGHAVQEGSPTLSTSCVKLDGIKLTVERLDRAGGLRFAKPLVLAFLNGCSTGPLNTWNSKSVAGFLCFGGMHRIACVTSIFDVPAAFASALAQRFWADFLAGRMLGEALRDARRALLAEYNNPLGLLYAVLGRVETRLVPPESR